MMSENWNRILLSFSKWPMGGDVFSANLQYAYVWFMRYHSENCSIISLKYQNNTIFKAREHLLNLFLPLQYMYCRGWLSSNTNLFWCSRNWESYDVIQECSAPNYEDNYHLNNTYSGIWRYVTHIKLNTLKFPLMGKKYNTLLLFNVFRQSIFKKNHK